MRPEMGRAWMGCLGPGPMPPRVLGEGLELRYLFSPGPIPPRVLGEGLELRCLFFPDRGSSDSSFKGLILGGRTGGATQLECMTGNCHHLAPGVSFLNSWWTLK